jgi:hypothetical protein
MDETALTSNISIFFYPGSAVGREIYTWQCLKRSFCFLLKLFSEVVGQKKPMDIPLKGLKLLGVGGQRGIEVIIELLQTNKK